MCCLLWREYLICGQNFSNVPKCWCYCCCCCCCCLLKPFLWMHSPSALSRVRGTFQLWNTYINCQLFAIFSYMVFPSVSTCCSTHWFQIFFFRNRLFRSIFRQTKERERKMKKTFMKKQQYQFRLFSPKPIFYSGSLFSKLWQFPFQQVQ